MQEKILRAAIAAGEYALSLVNKADATMHAYIQELTAFVESLKAQLAAITEGMSSHQDGDRCPCFTSLTNEKQIACNAKVEQVMDIVRSVPTESKNEFRQEWRASAPAASSGQTESQK